MENQRITGAAATAIYGRVQARATMDALRTGYHQLLGVEDMSAQTLDCHAVTELPYGGTARMSRAALAIMHMQAARKAP